jgi:alanine racemase
MAGWNNVTLTMLGRDVEGITELSYNDSEEKENAYGAGKMPVGRGSGNYKAECSLTLFLEEAVALQQSLAPGQRLTDIAPFDIAVSYEYRGFVYKDRVRNCEFTANTREIKQNDKTVGIKYDLIVSHIDWNII